MSLEDSEGAVAIGGVFGKLRADRHRPVPDVFHDPGFFPILMDEEMAVIEPFYALLDGFAPGCLREFLFF